MGGTNGWGNNRLVSSGGTSGRGNIGSSGLGDIRLRDGGGTNGWSNNRLGG